MEQAAKHTPGSWAVKETPHSSNQNFVVLDGAKPHSKRVCAVYSSNEEADARLIAAAPDLLAALQMVCDSGIPLADGIERAMLAAIKKARGE